MAETIASTITVLNRKAQNRQVMLGTQILHGKNVERLPERPNFHIDLAPS